MQLILQGNPIDWVSTHRYHHQYCDSDRDPHSPLDGFWFSHMNWMFDTNTITKRVKRFLLLFFFLSHCPEESVSLFVYSDFKNTLFLMIEGWRAQ